MRINRFANVLGTGRDGPIDASSDLESNLASSMAPHSVGCSSKLFEVQVCRNISVQITTRFTVSINGRQTSESWASRKSKRFHIFHGLVRSLND